MKVAIASDHGGMNIRKEIISLMKEMNIEYVDLGCECNTSVDYPDYAIPLAEKVANGEIRPWYPNLRNWYWNEYRS